MNKLPFLKKGTSGGMNFRQKTSSGSLIMLGIFFILIFVGFISITLRLFQLTIVKGAYYRKLSENNRVREIIIEPQRGTIFDRKGFTLARNVSYEKEEDGRIPSRRTYTNPEAFAHILGYRQVADEGNIDNDPCLHKLILGDKVGKKGIEKSFECDLRGHRGKKLTEVNASGEYVQTFSRIPPIDGKTLQLSVDEMLQSSAYELIKDQRAVVVAIKPQTGEVLILTSSPSFNPQYFEDGETEQTAPYFTDEYKPLFNRATEGVYPPGSTFKLIMAAAALEEGKVDTHTIIEDTGTVEIGGRTFGNWYFLEYGRTEGSVDIIKALQRSNDIYFYKAGEKLGVVKIKEWAELFGYGNTFSLPIDEKPGIIPSSFWKEETLDERWYLGDTYNLSIGQGYLSTTPLQVALMTSVLANNGTFCKPNLLKVGSQAIQTEPDCKKLPISDENIGIIQEGMIKACEPGGTGWPLFDFKIYTASDSARPEKSVSIACKTGTSESHHESGKPHAWFTAYAPAKDPEIVITVLVEAAGQGSDVAAPIAKELFTKYFERVE